MDTSSPSKIASSYLKHSRRPPELEHFPLVILRSLRGTRSAPCPVSQTSSLLDVVRQATGSAHRALEARLNLNDGSWTAVRYVAFLRATLSVIQPLEDTITRQLQLVDGTVVCATSPNCTAER
jgi:hypothetical protein